MLLGVLGAAPRVCPPLRARQRGRPRLGLLEANLRLRQVDADPRVRLGALCPAVQFDERQILHQPSLGNVPLTGHLHHASRLIATMVTGWEPKQLTQEPPIGGDDHSADFVCRDEDGGILESNVYRTCDVTARGQDRCQALRWKMLVNEELDADNIIDHRRRSLCNDVDGLEARLPLLSLVSDGRFHIRLGEAWKVLSDLLE